MNAQNHGDTADQQLRQITFGQAIRRGVRLRCPVCGRGRMFQNLLSMHKKCSHCEFPFERPAGYFLGSTYINYGVTAFTTTASYVLLYFVAGIEKQQLLPALLVFCLIFPLVFFRFARSLWLSLDCFFDRLGAEEAVAKSRREQSD